LNNSEEDFGFYDIIKKQKFNRISKFGLFGLKKQTTTFGTTKRFAPEPGSELSTTQQKARNAYQKTRSQISSSSNIQLSSLGQIDQQRESMSIPPVQVGPLTTVNK